MNNRFDKYKPFDIREWLRVAGRRVLGSLLLLLSIGLSSCQALNAVDDSLIPDYRNKISEIMESFHE